MTQRTPESADLGLLSDCAAELAEAFVSLASDIALVIDDDGVVRSVAQSASAPIVAQAGAWVGRPWIDTVSGDTRRKVELMLNDLKSTGATRRREVNLRAGGDGHVPVAFSALRLGVGGPVLAVGRDLRAVSAIQQRFLDAQQELERGYWRARQAESRYRLLFQVATDAVLTVDAHSLRVIEANHAAASLLGAGMALAGRVAPQLFDPAAQAMLYELLHNARRDGKPAELHARLPGLQATAAVSATPFRAGDGVRLLLRVRADPPPEPGIPDLNRTLALLVDSTRDGVVVTDSNGRVLVANPAFLSLVNAAAEDEVRGQALGEWVGRVDTDVSTLLAAAHAHGIAHLVRSSVRRSDGAHIDVDVAGALLAEGEQECFGFTLRECGARVEPLSALALALAALDERIGQVPFAQLMAQSGRLVEQRLLATALARTHGDKAAAAVLLGMTLEQLLQTLEREAPVSADTAASSH